MTGDCGPSSIHVNVHLCGSRKEANLTGVSRMVIEREAVSAALCAQE
jgi:hypothetical protein